MKRLLLALTILVSAGGLVCALQNAAARAGRQAAAHSQALMAETQLLAQARIQLTSMTEQVHVLKQKLEAQEGAPAGPGEDLSAFMASHHLSPSQSEQLLAQLGFDWSSSADYLIVSKDTLRTLSVDALHGTQLNNTACALLSITPDERAALEASIQAVFDQYKTWAQTHVQREEPHGDIVAKYTLSNDQDISLSLSNNFAGAIVGTLGQERGAFLLDYARSWMQDLGFPGGGENQLIVKRYGAEDNPRLNFQLRYSGNVMSTDVSPHQPFPEAFLPLFPNGWPDLAQREGFALPESFHKNP